MGDSLFVWIWVSFASIMVSTPLILRGGLLKRGWSEDDVTGLFMGMSMIGIMSPIVLPLIGICVILMIPAGLFMLLKMLIIFVHKRIKINNIFMRIKLYWKGK